MSSDSTVKAYCYLYDITGHRIGNSQDGIIMYALIIDTGKGKIAEHQLIKNFFWQHALEIGAQQIAWKHLSVSFENT